MSDDLAAVLNVFPGAELIETEGYGDAVDLYLAAGWQGPVWLPRGMKNSPPEGFTGSDGRWPTSDEIDRWRRQHTQDNIALRLPAGVVGLDFDRYKPAGETSYQAMLDELGPLPPSWASSSRDDGSGISLYRVPPDVRLKGAPRPGVEVIQRHHRYLICWPSLHPEGRRYRWTRPDGQVVDEVPPCTDLPELPARWLQELTERPDQLRERRPQTSSGLSWSKAVSAAYGDAMRDMVEGCRHDTAAAQALTLIRLEERCHPGAGEALDMLGAEFMARTEADRGGRAAVEREWSGIVSSARNKVTSTPATIPIYEPVERIDPYELIGASEANASEGHQVGQPPDDADDEPGRSWKAVHLDEIVDDILSGRIRRPTPTVGRRTDGASIFYPRRVNGLVGTSGSGKSMTAQHIAAQELNDGHHVVYIDLEDDEAGVVGRLLALGVDPDRVKTHLHYIHPDEPYGLAARVHLEDLIVEFAVTLVIIDSTGEAMSLDGADPDKDKDTAPWMRKLPAPLARLGPAVVLLDHTTNADADGTSLRASGSHRKRAAITGALYMVTTIREFAIGRAGAAKLTCAKDRLGNYTRGSKVAEFTVTSDTDHITAELVPPRADGTFRPTVLMEKISRYLELNPDATKRDVRRDVKGNSEAKDTALHLLIAESWVTVEQSGQASRHRSVKPYREAEDGGVRP